MFFFSLSLSLVLHAMGGVEGTKDPTGYYRESAPVFLHVVDTGSAKLIFVFKAGFSSLVQPHAGTDEFS